MRADLSADEPAGLRSRVKGGGHRARVERRLAESADLLVVSTPEGRRAARRRFGPDLPIAHVPDGMPAEVVSAAREPSQATVPLTDPGDTLTTTALVVLDPHVPSSYQTLRTLVQALPGLPGVRLAVVSNQGGTGRARLRELAGHLGVGSRFQWREEPADGWLSTRLVGDLVGVVVVGDRLESGVRLPSAYHRFVADGVPVLAQRSAPMDRAVTADASGAVADLSSVGHVHDAVTASVRHRGLLASRLEVHPPSPWDAEPFLSVLSRLSAVTAGPRSAPSAGSTPAAWTGDAAQREERVSPMPLRLGIGPANFAGQGWAWAKAAEQAVPGLRTEVFAVHQGALTFQSDRVVAPSTTATLDWQLAEQRHLLSSSPTCWPRPTDPCSAGCSATTPWRTCSSCSDTASGWASSCTARRCATRCVTPRPRSSPRSGRRVRRRPSTSDEPPTWWP